MNTIARILAIGLALVLFGCGSESADPTQAVAGADQGGRAGESPANVDSGAGGVGGSTVCPAGSETCPCYGNDTCDAGLSCYSGVCVFVPSSGGAGGGAQEAGGAAGDEPAAIAGGAGGAKHQECVPGCIGDEECFKGECVAPEVPCTLETAQHILTTLRYEVRGNACLKVVNNTNLDACFSSSVEIQASYRNTCDVSGSFVAVDTPADPQVPACEETVIQLLGERDTTTSVRWAFN